VNGINALAVPLFTRILTKTDYGLLGTCNNIQLFATNLFRLGSQQAVLKQYYEIDSKKKNDYLMSVVCYSFIWNVILILCFALVCSFFKVDSIQKVAIFPYIVLTIGISVFTSSYSSFEAEMRLLNLGKKYIIISVSCVTVDILLSMALIVFCNFGCEGKLLGCAVPYLILTLLFIFKRGKFSLKFGYWWNAIKFGFPLGFYSIFSSLAWMYVFLLLNANFALSTVGDFYVGRNLGVLIPEFIFQAIILTYQPFVYRHLLVSESSIITKYNSLFIVVFSFFLIIVILSARPILLLAASSKYLSSLVLMRLFLIPFIFRVLYYYPMLKLLHDNRSKLCTFCQTTSLLLFFVIVSCFFKKNGILVVPFALIFQECLNFILLFCFSKLKFKDIFSLTVLNNLCKTHIFSKG
jgi:O-antigen/teichoic acid export membrane protein